MDELPPTPFLSYATGPTGSSSDQIWVEGDTLIVRDGSILPPRCIKCNAPVTARPRSRKFSPQGGMLSYGLCTLHRRTRRIFLLFIAAICLLGLTLFIIGFSKLFQRQMNELVASFLIIGPLIIVATSIGAWNATRDFRVKKFDGNFIWLTGPCYEFLHDESMTPLAALRAQPPAAVPSSIPSPIPDEPDDDDVHVWVQDDILVVRDGTTLPPRCIKCNAPIARKLLTRKYSWHNDSLSLLIILGFVFYYFFSAKYRKTGTIHFGFCERHHRLRSLNAKIAIGISVSAALMLAIGGIIMYYRSDHFLLPYLMLGGLAFLFLGITWAAVGESTFRPARIDDHFLWLSGAGRPFLHDPTLPTISHNHPTLPNTPAQ